MGGFIAKQPNGLYCRFSTVVDCPTHWNFTREDYLNNCTGTVNSFRDGKDILERHLRPFSEVIEYFAPENMSQKEFDNMLLDVNEEVQKE
ncbi:hypothetical protein ACRC6Q_16690 [Planococcus sp. SE5232]|uniref:hypothetical protein n=1 Tax=unclassified Planococcus (in: firmicutes) TaxID=2662419 RepID=UPI003D6BF7C5